MEKKLKNFTILIAEDDEEVRVRMRNTLSFYFKEVYDADNGEEAYKIFLDFKPSLVISDIEMSNGNGIELVNNIRKIDSNTPIIVISAYSKEEYLLSLINLKIDQYILKPATRANLFDAIKKALIKDTNELYELCLHVSLDADNNTLIYDNTEIALRKKEKDFLYLLYRNKNSITKYESIQEYIWGDKLMTQDALKTFMKELRRKIPFALVENVVHEGYRLAKNPLNIID